jgi:hypothetical protein
MQASNDHDILIELKTAFSNLETNTYRSLDSVHDRLARIQIELEKRDLQHDKFRTQLNTKVDNIEFAPVKRSVENFTAQAKIVIPALMFFQSVLIIIIQLIFSRYL